MSARSNDPTLPELTITRVFDAPRSLVFEAWTKDEHLKKWSAPKGLTLPFSQGDLRVGGEWKAIMLTPEGVELKLGGVYREIIPNELLVFTHIWEEDDGPGPESIVTVRFEDENGKTRMTFTQSGFKSKESLAGHSEGWGECFDLLDELLAKLRAAQS
jgi:uncharacterized protein YndB with AHSA1/START domain